MTSLPLPLLTRATADAERFVLTALRLNHSTKGTETVNAINDLALITGHIGRTGAAPFLITGQCNAMCTREAGFTSSLPGYRTFECADDREALAGLWNVPVERIPTARGLAYPDLGVLLQSPETLEFLVVQDGFHPTPTTALADLVLPAAIWGEKEGTYTNSERRVSKVNRAVTPPGEARAGQLFVPFHWAEFNANQGMQSAFDPSSREPNYKQCAVRVERTAPASLASRRRGR